MINSVRSTKILYYGRVGVAIPGHLTELASLLDFPVDIFLLMAFRISRWLSASIYGDFT
jgi:hypothetical protein